MKISILSLGVHGTNENYGAVLQILAFQEYLKQKYKADVEVIDYYGLCANHLLSLNENRIKGIIRLLKTRVKYIAKIISRDKLTIRIRKHELFISKYLNTTKKYDYRSINKAKFDSDLFIAESDVIWDPSFRKTGFDKTYFLNCCCFEKGKRVIYAASMGDIKFSDEDKNLFINLITPLSFISVRETYAKQYIYELCKRHVESFLDPTLLFNSCFYDQYIQNTYHKINRPYIVVYFPAEANNEVLTSSEKYAKERDLDIVYLCRKTIPGRSTKIEYGIEDFLFFIKNSQAVFCDSFHGVCFSVIYRKPFFAFSRDDGKKVVDLCYRLGLEERIIHDGVLPDEPVDFQIIEERIQNERRRSYEWLKNAINA